MNIMETGFLPEEVLAELFEAFALFAGALVTALFVLILCFIVGLCLTETSRSPSIEHRD